MMHEWMMVSRESYITRMQENDMVGQGITSFGLPPPPGPLQALVKTVFPSGRIRYVPSCNISADHKMISSLNKCKIINESRNVCSGVACIASTASSKACLARWHARSGLP